MDRATFEKQTDAPIPGAMIRSAVERNLFDVWSAAFAIDFFRYRARLQRIAMDSLERVRPSALSLGFADFDEWFGDPTEEIIVPTDDDDFLSPSVRDIVNEFQPGTDIVVWPHVRHGYLDESTQRSYQPQMFLAMISNNCAIRKSFLVRNFSRETVIEMLSRHWIANQRIAEHLRIPEWVPLFYSFRMLVHPCVRHVFEFHSLYNEHPGSIFFLQTVQQMSDPASYLRSLDLVTPVYLRKDLLPFEPYVRRLESIWTTA